MKIMSLNVNRFSGMEDRDLTNGFEYLEQCPKATEIIEYIIEFLCGNPDGAVLLQEIPYMESPIKNEVTRRLYDCFKTKLSASACKVILPSKDGLSCTLAVVQEGSAWSKVPYVFVEDYQNKYVFLKHIKGLCVLGIHAPVESKNNTPKDIQNFFNKLKEYAERHSDEELIILGDMNVHSEKPCSYFTTFNTIRKEVENDGLGYCDKVPDGEVTHFKTGHTIDHVLISPILKGEVTVRVISKEELELSDHAVIIVDIKE